MRNTMLSVKPMENTLSVSGSGCMKALEQAVADMLLRSF